MRKDLFMVSIIVPVYNVEKYIDECVQSLVNQTYTNLEIILVDDGSTDQSGTKCDDWAKKDSRIKVIHKTNGGLRDALITGCSAAGGDYILFVDGDDMFKPHAAQVLVQAAQHHNADCVQFEYIYYNNNQELHFTNNKSEILSGDEVRRKALYDWFETGENHTQWNRGRTTKFYKSELVKTVLPLIDKKISLCEDFEMSLWLLLYCKKFVSLEGQYLYYWRYVDTSMSKNVTQQYIDNHLYFFTLLEKFAVTNNIPHSALDYIVDEVWIQLIAGTLAKKIPFGNKYKFLKIIKSNYRSSKNILKLADRYSFITRNAIKYLARFDCFVPCLLSQVYTTIKK